MLLFGFWLELGKELQWVSQRQQSLMDDDVLDFAGWFEVWLAREAVWRSWGLKESTSSSAGGAQWKPTWLWDCAGTNDSLQSPYCWKPWWKICWSTAYILFNHVGVAITINWSRMGKSVFIFLLWKAASRPGSCSPCILWALSSLTDAAVYMYVCSVFLPFHAWTPGYKRHTRTVLLREPKQTLWSNS